MSIIKLTTKRQATFPAEVCEQLDLKPGDEIDLVPRVENGDRFWMLRKRSAPSRPWLGALRHFAENVTDHSTEAIRESIVRGRRSSPA